MITIFQEHFHTFIGTIFLIFNIDDEEKGHHELNVPQCADSAQYITALHPKIREYNQTYILIYVIDQTKYVTESCPFSVVHV